MGDARSLPDRVDAVVVGAGLAGASAARALSLRGLSVLVLEAERTPGTHASGRNAGILRRVVEEPSTAALARRGGAGLADPPGDLDLEHPLLHANGLLLVSGPGEEAAALGRAAEDARRSGLAVEELAPDAAARRAPVLRGRSGIRAAWHAADGTVDVAALLDGMLRSAKSRGAVLAPGCSPAAVRTEGGEYPPWIHPAGASGPGSS